MYYLVARAVDYPEGHRYIKVYPIDGPLPDQKERDCIPVGVVMPYEVVQASTPQEAIVQAKKFFPSTWKGDIEVVT